MMFTATAMSVFFAGTTKPHHVVTPEGVALGYSHLGMLAAARWLLSQTKASLIQALDEHPGYQLRIVGGCKALGQALDPGRDATPCMSAHNSPLARLL